MNIWWLLIIIPAVVALAWFAVFRKPVGENGAAHPKYKYKSNGPVQVTRNQPARQSHHYYGATVQVCSNPCDAVREIANKRYLSEDAPHFPLPDCDREECHCIMRPQDDRRAGYDRRGDSFSAYGNFELDRHEQKRQEKRDRRRIS